MHLLKQGLFANIKKNEVFVTAADLLKRIEDYYTNQLSPNIKYEISQVEKKLERYKLKVEKIDKEVKKLELSQQAVCLITVTQ